MLERYIAIQEPSASKPLKSWCHRGGAQEGRGTSPYLTDMNSVYKTLQSENCTLANVRLLFDSVEKYSVMGDCLHPASRTVHSSVFESAVVKAINNVSLSANETKSVRSFVNISPGTA